jgi:ferredoxin-NADP reductase
MTYTLELQSIENVTPDTRRLRFERPDGYTFEPGQATELALQIEGYEGEGRPFTFTSQPEDPFLELIVKTYPDHDGVTAQIADVEPGVEVAISEPFGAIRDRGPGVFIAGGAGITPFLAILRRRERNGTLDGCTLLFANDTEADIICRDELEAMEGLETHFVVTDQDDSPLAGDFIDGETIEEIVDDPTSTRFYLCGPPPMMTDVGADLDDLGADPESVVLESD